MSDQNQLATLQQELTSITAGQMTLDQIGMRLQPLWEQASTAQDEQAMTLINEAWDRAEALAASNDRLAAIAAATVTVAQEFQSQRDQIADENGKLVNAMRKVDTDNPLVSRVYEAAEEQVYEWIQQSMSEGIHTDTPGMDIVENGHLGDGVDEVMADEFLSIVMGYSDELSDDLYEELSAFIQDFTTRVNDAWVAKRERLRAEQESFLKLKPEERLKVRRD